MLVVTARRPAVTFTPRQLRILDLMRTGLTPKEIAHRLEISVWTVRMHLDDARRRSDTRTTVQLVDLYARTRGARRTI
jgi:DNA-binding CsgD family transcriptional regulator